MSKKIDKSEYGKIVDLYNQNLTQKDISTIYGVTDVTIGNILKKCGVQCKNRRYLNFSYGDVNGMHKLYMSGCTSSDIGKMYGISEDSVRQWFKKYGFEIKNNSLAHRIYEINEKYFDCIDTPNKAYILGLLYADGNNLTKKQEITLALQECDKHILERIKNELEYTGPLRFVNYAYKNIKYKNQYVLNIANKHLSEMLNTLGVWNNKSLILEWPSWLEQSLCSHFVRGYFDGDGCLYISKNNKVQEISIVSTKMFLLGLQNVVKQAIDVNLHVKKHEPKYKEVTKIVRINSKNDVKKFLDWIYKDSDLMLQRKYDKYQHFLSNINNSCCE